MTDDKMAQRAVEHSKHEPKPDKNNPPAGPHARESLTDHEKTPGTGSLPDHKSGDIDAGSE